MKTTNIRDQAKSDQHANAINEHSKELAQSKGLGPTAYQAVCWRLFLSPNSSDSSNVQMFATLLFSLPASNDKLELSSSE